MADETADPDDDLCDELLRAESVFLARFQVGGYLGLNGDGELPDLVYKPDYGIYVQGRLGPHPIRVHHMTAGMAFSVAAALPRLWKRCVDNTEIKSTMSDVLQALRAFVDEKARELADGPASRAGRPPPRPIPPPLA